MKSNQANYLQKNLIINKQLGHLLITYDVLKYEINKVNFLE